jgi:hypothetical protein
LKHGLVGEHAVAAVQQVPLVQVPPQVCAQPPQFALSVLVSTQVPLQYVCPAVQHVPLLQVPLHVAPQAPQLARSVFVSIQAPLQLL